MTDDMLLRQGFEAFNRGDLATADQVARTLLARQPQQPGVVSLAAMTAYRRGELPRAIPLLRAARAALPGNEELDAALVFALFNSGALDEALTVATPWKAPRFRRIVALILYRQGRYADAVAEFERVLATLPADHESWSNLGLALSVLGEGERAIAAFDRAIALQPDIVDPYIQRDDMLAGLERHQERAELLRAAIRQRPDAAALWVQLGLAEGAADAIRPAEAAYRRALELEPHSASAILEYGILLERLNRLDDLDALIATARQRRVQDGRIDFLEAWALRRRGRFAEALALAERSGEQIRPARRAQLTAELCDRLGDTDRAFAAFAEMNRVTLDGPAARHAAARDYAAEIAANAAVVTADWVAGWPAPPPADMRRADPVFVLGFPRSGTTLLDTLLMNLPEVAVFEEQPMIERIEEAAGGQAALARLSAAEVAGLRQRYFDFAAAFRPDLAPEHRLIDKFPLHLVRAPMIHRLFPAAPIVFVERHPCDVVLSCFMARFQVNKAMIQLSTIEGAARLYDAAMDAWTRAEAAMPLVVHRVRYERLVGGGLEAELRALLAALGLPWHPEVLDNRAAAARRGRVETASYAQVGEPITARAVGRWERYRQHLQPVLPVLAPWVERLGYTL